MVGNHYSSSIYGFGWIVPTSTIGLLPVLGIDWLDFVWCFSEFFRILAQQLLGKWLLVKCQFYQVFNACNTNIINAYVINKIIKMKNTNNSKREAISKFEWWDRGEHSHKWLLKKHKKLANRYERRKLKRVCNDEK